MFDGCTFLLVDLQTRQDELLDVLREVLPQLFPAQRDRDAASKLLLGLAVNVRRGPVVQLVYQDAQCPYLSLGAVDVV